MPSKCLECAGYVDNYNGDYTQFWCKFHRAHLSKHVDDTDDWWCGKSNPTSSINKFKSRGQLITDNWSQKIYVE
jgi:hypothetical protein